MEHGKLTKKKKKKKEKETDAGNATNVERPSAQEAVTAAEGRRQKADGPNVDSVAGQWCFTGDGKGERQSMQHHERESVASCSNTHTHIPQSPQTPQPASPPYSPSDLPGQVVELLNDCWRTAAGARADGSRTKELVFDDAPTATAATATAVAVIAASRAAVGECEVNVHLRDRRKRLLKRRKDGHKFVAANGAPGEETQVRHCHI